MDCSQGPAAVCEAGRNGRRHASGGSGEQYAVLTDEIGVAAGRKPRAWQMDPIAGSWLRINAIDQPNSFAKEGRPEFDVRQWAIEAHDGGAVVIGDARLDHANELAQALGLPYLANAHAALILAAWRRWNVDCFRRLEGDFALAIWDDGCLVLARDAIGQRPLHWRIAGDRFRFASTPLALASIDGPPKPDLDRLAAYLALYPEDGPSSFLAGVQRVMPGHCLIVERSGEPRHLRWWHPDLTPLAIGYGDAVALVRGEIDRAVAAAVSSESDVVAAQLSGGLDSSLVVASAAALAPAGKTIVAITAIASGPTEHETSRAFVDEDRTAAATAAGLPCVRHVVVRSPPCAPLLALEHWLPTIQRPMYNACNLSWLDGTFAAARDSGAQVMLTGLLGNHTISYNGSDRLPDLARKGRWPTLLRELSAYRKLDGGSWIGMAALALAPWIPESVWVALTSRRGHPTGDSAQRGFLNLSSSRVRRAKARAGASGWPTSGRPGLLAGGAARLRYLGWTDPGLVNHSVRLRFGVELRDPTAARRVVELTLRLGDDHFFRDGLGRRLARALLDGRVPARVVDERRRGHQGANWRRGFMIGHEGLTKELESIRLDPELCDLIDIDRMCRLIAPMPTEGWDDPVQVQTYRHELTAALGAARFARHVREADCQAHSV